MERILQFKSELLEIRLAISKNIMFNLNRIFGKMIDVYLNQIENLNQQQLILISIFQPKLLDFFLFQQKTVVNNTKICIQCKLNINNSTKNVNALVNKIQSWTNVKASSKMVWRSIPISNTIAPLGATLASGAGTRCLSGSACCHSVNLCTHVGREHACRNQR